MRHRAIPIALASTLVWTAAPGQTAAARVEGLVTDASGASVMDAHVEAVQDGTNIRWATTSAISGAYRLPALPPGRFRVEIRRDGFKPLVTDGVRLEAGALVRVDATLSIGGPVETVYVVAPSAIANRASPELRVVFDPEEAARVPVNGRNYLGLTLMAPGITATNPQSFVNGQRMTSGGRPYINGNRKETTSFLLDGVDINQYTDNLVSYLPSPDALESVAITTGAPSAEWGNYLGGIVSTRLKSGTNVLHGSAFAFGRDEALNATNLGQRWWVPVDPLNSRRKAPLSHRTLGGTMGGPLRRSRLFAFADYQAVRRREGPSNGLVTVATDEMRRGDFSALLAGPNPQHLYDPVTTRPDPANPGRYLRDPFPGNQIPLARMNPVAAALFASPLYPLPDYAGLAGNGASRSSSERDWRQGDVKVDGRLGGRHGVSVRGSGATQRTAVSNEPVIFTGGSTEAPTWSGGLRWTVQGERGWANEATAGITDIGLRLTSDDDGDALGSMGDAIGIAGANARRQGLPALGFGGAVSELGNSGIVQRADSRLLQFQDTLTWTAARHVVRAGAVMLRSEQDAYFSGNNGQLGRFEFNGQYTRDVDDARSFGSPIADFVLGYPYRTARGDYAEAWQHQTTLWAGFVQDDWRPRADLTVNLGLRYEYRTPLVEERDRQVTYDTATGEALFAGQDGNSRALYEPYGRDWQPRVGVAWAPERFGGSRSVRAAYGITSFQEGTGTNLRLPLNPPYFNELELVNRDPTVLGLSIDRGFDGIRERDAMTGAVLRGIDPDFRPARAQQWHVTTEGALGRSLLLSVGYVGNSGRRLAVPVNANQASVPGGSRPLDPVLPQIGSVILTTSIGKQRYDALQTVLRRLHANGWSLMATYTWGHALSDSRGFYSDSGQSAEPATFWPNPRDQAAEWGSSAFDARHHATVAWTMDVPWGRGRRWGADAPAWVDAVMGGWSIDGAWRAHTGYAITVLAPDQSQTGARSGRPDRVGSGEGTPTAGPNGTWFDTSVFVLPRLGTFGNAGTGIIRGPGLNVVDVALGKSFPTGGRSRLELRAETYNLFNTPVFEAPDRQLTSATFGQVRSTQLERQVQLGVRWVF